MPMFPHTSEQKGCVKTTIIYQLKRLCVPFCACTENIFINSIHISLYDISLTQNILYQIKRDVAVWKRLGCPQRNQRTWWQIVATPYAGLALLGFRIRDIDFCTAWWLLLKNKHWKGNHDAGCYIIFSHGFGLLKQREFLKQSDCQSGTPFSHTD